ncbi:MAG: hypothetical protein EDM05_67655 [Leptolyngbya sp. IPPAS B-1204]|nr:MAG: hypothetical protein EDM05_11430 [Leptolyngbya sp. IPPAS B-1204]
MVRFPNLITLLLLLINSIAVLAGVGRAIYLERPITRYFHEKEYITRLSLIQLLIAAGIALVVCRLSSSKFKFEGWRSPCILWLMIAIGFLFLAVDEAFELHEDFFQVAIFTAFNLKRNFITVRIHDFIVLLYGLVGIGLIYLYLPTIKQNYSRRMLRHLTVGFALLLVMVILDTLGNRKEIPVLSGVLPTFTNVTLRRSLHVIEEAFKLFSQAFFIGGFCAAMQEAWFARKVQSLQKH